MDNLTHSLVGLVLARVGLNRLGVGATALVIVGANLPDIDVVTAVAGRLKYLEYHRGWTHSFALAPVLALLPLPIWWLSTRKCSAGLKSFAYAWLAVFAGLLSHLFLDCWNTYGVRILLPFSDDWYRLDWVYIVDLWIWAILLVGALAPLLVRLVDNEIGARRGSGRGGAWVVLLLLCGFIALRPSCMPRRSGLSIPGSMTPALRYAWPRCPALSHRGAGQAWWRRREPGPLFQSTCCASTTPMQVARC